MKHLISQGFVPDWIQKVPPPRFSDGKTLITPEPFFVPGASGRSRELCHWTGADHRWRKKTRPTLGGTGFLCHKERTTGFQGGVYQWSFSEFQGWAQIALQTKRSLEQWDSPHSTPESGKNTNQKKRLGFEKNRSGKRPRGSSHKGILYEVSLMDDRRSVTKQQNIIKMYTCMLASLMDDIAKQPQRRHKES